MRADKAALAKTIGPEAANLLHTIPKAVISMTRENLIRASNYVLTLNAAKKHFAATINGRCNEVIVVLYLNSKNRLIDEDIRPGRIDRFSIYPREILRRIALGDASAVMMAHNHPSGDPSPSDEDIRLTRKLEEILDLVDVILLDHMIFGEVKPYSLCENGCI